MFSQTEDLFLLFWFSGLPLLKGSIQFPPSPGHILLFFPWCWLLCLSDPTISQFHSLNQRILIHQKKMNSSLWFGGSQAPFHGAHTSAVTGTRKKWMKEARWPLQVAVWFYIGSASPWKLPMSEILEKEESLVKFTLQNQIINGQWGVSPLKYWTLLSEDTYMLKVQACQTLVFPRKPT